MAPAAEIAPGEAGSRTRSVGEPRQFETTVLGKAFSLICFASGSVLSGLEPNLAEGLVAGNPGRSAEIQRAQIRIAMRNLDPPAGQFRVQPFRRSRAFVAEDQSIPVRI